MDRATGSRNHRVRTPLSAMSSAPGDSSGGENQALLARIAVMEAERKELQADFEQLCKQQSGYSGTINVMARMQARRAGSLEQELAAAKHMVATLSMDLTDMQRDLHAVTKAKGDMADLYKTEVIKVKKIDRDVKFYQARAGEALAERDSMQLEVNSLRAGMGRLEDSNARLAGKVVEREQELLGVESRQEELEGQAGELQEGHQQLLEKLAEVQPVEEVVIRLWRSRAAARGVAEAEGQVSVAEMARELLLEEEGEAEEVVAGRESNARLLATTRRLAAVLEGLRREQQEASQKVQHALQQERVWQEVAVRGLGERVVAAQEAVECQLEEERERGGRVREALQGQLKEAHSSLARLGGGWGGGGVGETGRNRMAAEEEDMQSALAQALHEKVATLLLLSQQEERHMLHLRTTGGMEDTIMDLRSKLRQVSSEKVEALLQAADAKAHRRCQEDGLRVTPPPGNGMMVASWKGEHPSERPPPPPSSSSGLPLPLLPSASGMAATYLTWLKKGASGRGRASDETARIAGLRVDNVSLAEGLGSAERYRMTAARIRSDFVKFSLLEGDVCAADGALLPAVGKLEELAVEARQLKRALGGFELPISCCATLGGGESEKEKMSAGEVGSGVGLELAEWMLLALEGALAERGSVLCVSLSENLG